MPRRVLGGLIQAAVADHRSRDADRHDPAGRDRRAPPAHRGGRQEGRADPLPAGDLQRPVLLPVAGRALVRRRRGGARARRPSCMARVREEVPDGDRRAGLRARAGGRLLQHRRGVSTPTARTSASTARTTSRTRPGFWEKYFFKPGNLGYPVFKTRVRDDRRLHLLRPPLPRRRAAARPERRRDRLQPVGDGRRALAVPVEARAAGARGRQRLLHGAASTASAPRRRGTSASSTARRTSSTRAATSSRPAREDKDELVVAEMDLDMIEEVRRVWQFYRDRRPGDCTAPMAEQRAMSTR